MGLDDDVNAILHNTCGACNYCQDFQRVTKVDERLFFMAVRRYSPKPAQRDLFVGEQLGLRTRRADNEVNPTVPLPNEGCSSGIQGY